MKITTGSVFRASIEIENWMFIKIETDEHLCGYGEISSSPLISDLVANLAVTVLNNLTGKNPLEIDNCLKAITQWTFPNFSSNIIFTTVVSGIDQALWDIAAKKRNNPLYSFVGCHQKSVPLYANLNRALRNNKNQTLLIENTKKALDEHFDAVKIAPFETITPELTDTPLFTQNVKKAIDKIAEICRIAGEKKTAIDCHQRFNQKTAALFLKELEKKGLNPAYIEDLLPYTSSDCDCLYELKKRFQQFTFAAGETCTSLAQIQEIIHKNCYTIFNPDVKFVGGVTEMLKIISAIEDSGHLILPHNPTGPISTAFSAVMAAYAQNETQLEFPYGNQKSRNLFLGVPENIHQGKYFFTEKPGIGIEPSTEFLNNFAFYFSDGKWIKP